MTLASPSIHTSLHMFCWEERRIKEEDGLREGFDCKAASQQISLSLSLSKWICSWLAERKNDERRKRGEEKRRNKG